MTKSTRLYVNVMSFIDHMGFMTPREVILKDGRVFPIESVKDFHPASTVTSGLHGDCYTVLIKGQEKYLFFEKADERQSCRFGRWFFETAANG